MMARPAGEFSVAGRPSGATERLARRVTWRSAVIVALGAALLVTVSLGPMTHELGYAAPFVWLFAALVGALQCVLLVELAIAFPSRAGGTATYVHAVLGRRLPLLAAASSWGYWFAWTPGIAVNLILAAACLRATIWPGLAVLPAAVSGGAVLYVVNGLGLRASMRVAGCIAVAAVVPLLVILAGAILHRGDVHVTRLATAGAGDHGGSSRLDWALLAKWTFVAAWSAYGAEIASTIVAEMRDGRAGTRRALLIAAGVGLLAFGLLPFVAFALVGAPSLVAEPLPAFMPLAEAAVPGAGRPLVGVMLTSALALGALAFIVASSRTVYQMAQDGYLPRGLATVNGRGVPIGSLVLDATIIFVLLAIFETRVVDVVAAANVGYLVVFVLIPMAYLALHRARAPSRRKSLLAWMAALLAVFNATLLVVGGLQWGAHVIVTGAAVMSLVMPVWMLRRHQDRRSAHRGREEATANAA
jgi:amino acid transporter